MRSLLRGVMDKCPSVSEPTSDLRALRWSMSPLSDAYCCTKRLYSSCTVPMEPTTSCQVADVKTMNQLKRHSAARYWRKRVGRSRGVTFGIHAFPSLKLQTGRIYLSISRLFLASVQSSGRDTSTPQEGTRRLGTGLCISSVREIGRIRSVSVKSSVLECGTCYAQPLRGSSIERYRKKCVSYRF